MIFRFWRGWTTAENADAYERLLCDEILPAIAQRLTEGYRGARVFRREVDEGAEFLTVLTFESMAAIHAFAGEDAEVAHVPAKARALLLRFDQRAQHYAEIRLGASA